MLLKMRSKMQNEKGFTLVELMVVVVILGILVAIAIPVYNNITKTANRSAVESNLRIIDSAVMMYKADKNTTEHPQQTDLDPYIEQWPTGPTGVKYDTTNSRAVVEQDGTVGDWYTLSSGQHSLPIDWEAGTGTEPEEPENP